MECCALQIILQEVLVLRRHTVRFPAPPWRRKTVTLHNELNAPQQMLPGRPARLKRRHHQDVRACARERCQGGRDFATRFKMVSDNCMSSIKRQMSSALFCNSHPSQHEQCKAYEQLTNPKQMFSTNFCSPNLNTWPIVIHAVPCLKLLLHHCCCPTNSCCHYAVISQFQKN